MKKASLLFTLLLLSAAIFADDKPADGKPKAFENPKSPLYSSPLSTHYGSIKASFKYTTIGVNTSFRMPILGYGKRIRYEYTAIDISTQIATTLMASLVYVDASYLGYLFDCLYLGAGGGLSVGFVGITPNFVRTNPIIKFGIELTKCFHQINYTPFNYTYDLENQLEKSVVRLISYQVGYKF